MRAMSRRLSRSAIGFSRPATARRKRRSVRSRCSSAMRSSISFSERARMSLVFMVGSGRVPRGRCRAGRESQASALGRLGGVGCREGDGRQLGAHDELGLDRELLDREAQRLAGDVLGHAADLEEDAARLDDGHPVLGRALALAHAGLGRLLGDRLVREDPDPHLADALHVARHGDTGGLDLAAREPAGVERLDPVVAKGDPGAAVGEAGHAALLHLAELGPLRHQHVVSVCVPRGRPQDGFRRVSAGRRRRLRRRGHGRRRTASATGAAPAAVAATAVTAAALAATALTALAPTALGKLRAPRSAGAARQRWARGPACR